MFLYRSAVYASGNIHNTHEKPRKRKKIKEGYSGWQDEPYHSAKGEEALWRAVITQAMVDATTSNRKPEYMYHKMEAIHWLTHNSADFLDVCLRAGLDADHVRIRAKKALANPGAWRTEAGQSERYEERKAMRARKKLTRKETLQFITTVVQGPWSLEVAYAE